MSARMSRGGIVAAIGILVAITSIDPFAASAQEKPGSIAEALTAKGAWKPTVRYRRDDVVTSRGSTWRSKRNNNKGRIPGQTQPSSAAFWELLARGFNPRGPWIGARRYQPNDLVTSNGSTWRARRTNRNKAPVAGPNWERFAAQGAAGPAGATGPQGPAGPNTGVPDGTNSFPGISFDDDPETGIYSPENGKIALVEDGQVILQSNGTDNIAVGRTAMSAGAPGARNTALGVNALANVGNLADDNVAIGYRALLSNTGDQNTAVGNSAMFRNSSGSANTAVGYNALSTNTAPSSFNTAVGHSSLASNDGGFSNTAVGSDSLSGNILGTANTAIGAGALDDANATDNTAVGALAMGGTTTGSNNVAVGYQALAANDTGSSNVALGYNAGVNAETPNNSIFIGNIGATNDTTTIKIGTQNAQQTTFIAGIAGVTVSNAVAVQIDAVTGQLGSTPSSRRYKQDIAAMPDMSAMLGKLRPVTFRYKKPYADGSKPLRYGLIAEEVAEVFPALAVFKDGRPETVKYHLLPSFLLAGYQAQQKTIAAQAERIEALEGRLGRLERLLPQTKAAALQ
jgi:hypothetical protein